MSSPAHAESATADRILWLQVGLTYAALEGALWTSGTLQGALIVLTTALATAFSLSERGSWPAFGLAPGSIRRGWWIVPIGAAIGGIILLAAWRSHTLRLPPDTPSVYVGIGLALIWALLQQFLVESFFFLRLEQLLRGGRRAVVGAAVLFAGAHVPNPVLVPVTLAGGLILSELFRRYRTIYLLAVAQALVALSLSVSVPETVLHDMRVGIGYVCYPAACHSSP